MRENEDSFWFFAKDIAKNNEKRRENGRNKWAGPLLPGKQKSFLFLFSKKRKSGIWKKAPFDGILKFPVHAHD